MLLALVMALAGCNTQFMPEKVNLENETAGINSNANSDNGVRLSHVQVSIGGNARTILPVLNGGLKWGFSKFTLSIEPAGGNTQNTPADVEIANGDKGEIVLLYGDWIVSATAYVNVEGADYPAASGSVYLKVCEDEHFITIYINMPESGDDGTFNINVRYPSSVSASVTLAPLGGGSPVIDNIPVDSGEMESVNIPGGVYFLTVSATDGERTVTRNEVVHIYPHSPTNADYAFTKLDFSASYTALTLSGTIQFLFEGEQPPSAALWVYTYGNIYVTGTSINFTEGGNGTWDVSIGNLHGASSLYFKVGCNGISCNVPTTIPVPLDDKAGIDLGTVELDTTPLPADTWVNGEIASNDIRDYYSIQVTAGENYYFWLNNRNGGTKTINASIWLQYNNSNSGYITGGNHAWIAPVSFIASSNNTVYIIIDSVSGDYDTGTYAIAYSTNNRWWNNNFNPPDNAVPLTAGTWLDGNVETGDYFYFEDWYSVNVTAGTTYYFWLNDEWEGDGSKTLDVDVGACGSGGGSSVFWRENAWNSPASYTAYADDTIYIRVSWNWDETGTYAIAYSTDNERPE